MINPKQQVARVTAAVVAGLLLVLVSSLDAGTAYTWTNTVNNASGYWTNGILWGNASTLTYPGAASGDSAYLTNEFSGTYTDILNSALANSISTLAISNALGEAWLIVTNMSLTNTTLRVGSGGRLRIVSGGVITGLTTLTLTGTNANLIASGGGAIFGAAGTINFSGSGSTVDLGAGAWTMNDNFIIGNTSGTASNNALIGGKITMSGAAGHNSVLIGDAVFSLSSIANDNNSLILTNAGGGLFGSAIDLFVGANYGGSGINGVGGGNNTTVILSNSVFTLGNSGASGPLTVGNASTNNSLTFLANSAVNGAGVSIRVGYYANAVSNVINVNGATLTNFGGLLLGSATGSSANKLLIYNGGIISNAGSISIAGNQNSLLATNGGVVYGKGAITIGASAGQFGNTINLGNGIWDFNSASLTVGGANNASNNTFIGGTVTNVGLGSPSGGLLVGSVLAAASSGNNFNTVIVTNSSGGFFMTSAGQIQVGGAYNANAGGNNNTVVLSNSVLWGGGASVSVIGNGSSSNSMTLLANSSWNNNNQALYLGGTAAAAANSNSLYISGAVLSNFGVVYIGGWNVAGGESSNSLVMVNNSVLTNFTGLQVGAAPGNNFNSAIFTNGSQVFMKSGGVRVGSATGSGAGGNNNTVTFSNSVLKSTSDTAVGAGSSNNTLNVLGGTVWDNGNANLVIGANDFTANFQSFNNRMLVNGAIISNVGWLAVGGTAYIGNSPVGISNRLDVINGGILSNVTALYVGGAVNSSVIGSDYNSLIVTGNGAGLFMTSAGSIEVGAAANQQGGGNNNTVILSNSVLIGLGYSIIGNRSTNNSMTVLADSVWNNNNVPLLLGGWGGVGGISNTLTLSGALVTNASYVAVGSQGGAFGNQMIVNYGGIVSNINGLEVGIASGADRNSLIVTNGGRLFMNSGTIVVGSALGGATGGGSNTVILSNSVLNTTQATFIGSGSSNNVLRILDGTVWDNAGQNITVGAGVATGNVFTISGAIVTNVNVLSIFGGGLNLSGNSLLSVKSLLSSNNIVGIITNSFFTTIGSGATLITSNTAGQTAANIVIPTNQSFSVNGTWLMQGGNNSITSSNGSNPNGGFYISGGSVVVTNGAKLYTTLGSVFNIQNGGSVLVGGVGSTITNTMGFRFQVGSAGNLSSLTILDGGVFVTSPSTIGAAAGVSNSVLVSGSGSVWSNTGTSANYSHLPIGAATGAKYNSLTVSNGGYVYVGGSSINASLGLGENGVSNWVLVTGSGSIITNKGYLSVGYFSGYNTMTIANSGTVYNTAGVMSTRGQNAGNNLIVVTDTGSVWKSSGVVSLGGESATYNNNSNNVIIVSNGAMVVSAGLIIGSGGSGNNNSTVTITGPGSVWTNTSTTTISANSNAFNSLTVTNGGAYLGGGAVTVGGGVNASNNNYNVIGADNRSAASNGLITVGLNGGGNNAMTVTNADVWSLGLFLGNGSSNNSVTVQEDVAWDMRNGQLRFGNGTGNVLVVADSSTVTNVGGIGLLGSGLTFNLTNNILMGYGADVMTARVYLAGGSLTLGASGEAGDNTLTISNETYFGGGSASIVGNNSSNNILTILTNTLWSGGAAGLTIGTGAATGNGMAVIGGMVTNPGAVTIGATGGSKGNSLLIDEGGIVSNAGAVVIGAVSGANGNSLTITNGAQMFGTNVTIGSVAGAASNTALVTGSGSVWSNSGVLSFGAGRNNSFTAADGAQVVVDNFQTGGGTSNQFLLTGTGTVARTTSTSILTFGGTYNSLIVSNGAKLFEAVGAGNQGYVSGGGFNNKFIVTGTGSVFRTGLGLFLNYAGGGGTNQLIIADAGLVVASSTDLGGNPGTSFGLQVLVTGGGGMTNTGGTYPLKIGDAGSTGASVIISNGGYIVLPNAGAIIGLGGGGSFASNSTLLVTGAGSVLTNGGTLWVSQYGSYDTMTIANSGTVFDTTGNIGANTTSSFNMVTLTDTGSVWRNSGAINVGGLQNNTYNNQLIVSNGALATSGSGGIGGGSSQANSNTVTLTGPGSTWTNTGLLKIGTGSSNGWNSLTVADGATYIGGNAITNGWGANANSNSLNLIGTDSAVTFSNAGLITIGGSGGGFNTMTATNANIWSAGLTIGNGSSNNTVTVFSDTAWDQLGNRIVIGSSASATNLLQMSGGIISNAGAVLATGTFNRVVLNGGTLDAGWITNNTGQALVIGDGTSSAKLALRSNAISFFANGLVVTNKGYLTGIGTITGGLTIKSNGVFSPGNSPGLQTVDYATWEGGGSYLFEITNFIGTAGVAWDLLNVTSGLTNTATAGNPFIVKLDSLGATAANFDAGNEYAVLFTTFGAQSGYAANRFTVDSSSFSNAPASPWGVSLIGSGLYLTYSAFTNAPDFVWGFSNGAWNVAGNWTNNAAPSAPGSDTLRLQFGTNTLTQFTATNDTARTLNAILLSNGGGAITDVLAGSAITFSGSNAVVVQQNVGAFIISNSVVLATNLTFRGVGAGQVTLASNITGNGQVTMKGIWNLVLRGSNDFAGPVLVNSLGGTLTLGNAYAVSTNSITVSNGTVNVNLGTTPFILGNGWSNQAALVTGTAAYWTNSGNLVVGSGAATGNTLQIDNGGSLSAQGVVMIGTNGALQNTLTISAGASLFARGATNAIGYFANSNTAVIVGNGVAGSVSKWDGGFATGLTNLVFVGYGSTGNVLWIDGAGITGGALLTNAELRVGDSGGVGNTVIVTNGAQLKIAGGVGNIMLVGGGAGASNNKFIIVGSGAPGIASTVDMSLNNGTIGGGALSPGALATNNSLVIDGNGFTGGASLIQSGAQNNAFYVGTTRANGNSLVITNGGLFYWRPNANNSVFIGDGSSNNAALVMGGSPGVTSVWAMANIGTLFIGQYRPNNMLAANNSLRVDGAGWNGGAVVSVSNSALTVGQNAIGNSLILTNGASLTSGAATIGNNSTFAFGSYSNFAMVVGGVATSVWNLSGSSLTVGNSSNTSFNSVIVDGNGRPGGAVITNVNSITLGTIIVSGAGQTMGNSLIITNGGRVIQAGALNNSFVGQRSSNNFAVVSDANSVWNLGNGGTLIVGSGNAGASNQLRITAGGLLTNGNLFVGQSAAGASSNTVTFSDGNYISPAGRLEVGDAGFNSLSNLLTISGTSTVLVQSNIVHGAGNREILNGGTLSVTSLIVSNGVGVNRLIFNGGTLAVSGQTVISNGQDFVIGDGSSAATFNTLTGTHIFQNNLIVTNNGILAGTGNLIVNGGAGSVVIGTNGVLAPGGNLGLGTLSISGTNQWTGGGRYRFEISDFTGASSGATDLVNATYLLLSATAANRFVVDLNSLSGPTTAGLANNFNADTDYTLTLATAATSVNGGITADKFSVTTSSFSNPFDGVWTVSQSGLNLVLNYASGVSYVWDNVTGAFSNSSPVGINWLDDVQPPSFTTNVVMYFGGTVGQPSYTASNDINSLVAKRLILTNSSAATQYIIGNAITLGGLAPTIQQNSNGMFVISNAVVMATNLTVLGTGSGTLALNGVLGGAYSLTKTGNFTLALGGANTNTGSVIVDGGTLTLQNNGAVSSSTQLLVNALGTVVADGGAPTVNKLAGSGAVVLTNGAALTLNNSGALNSSTFAGGISGDGSLTKGGAGGTLTLSGVNSYRGDTVVSAGTLTVSGSGYLASTNLIVNSSATFNWSASGAMTNRVAISTAGRVNFNNDGTIGALSGSGLVTLGAGQTVQVGFGDVSSSFGGRLTGNSGALTKVGNGTWSLTGNGSFGTAAVSAGTWAVAGGSLTNNQLLVSGSGVLALQAGSVAVNQAVISNGQDFVVGNGSSLARFSVSGTAYVQQNLIVTNYGTLTGSGSMIVAGGQGSVIIQSGGVQAPGDATGPGTMTVAGTNVWQGGGRYQWQVNDLTPGLVGSNPGWDWLNVLGALTNEATSLNPFVIDITSLSGSSPGLAANFDSNGKYTNIIATATNAIYFVANSYQLSTANFANPFDGVFQLKVLAGTNLVLTYAGSDVYTWKDITGGFSNGANWVEGNAPPGGVSNIVAYFGGSTAVGYVATNEIDQLVVKKLILTNNTATVQTLVGSNLTFGGLAPELDQNGSGAFLISNAVVLATNTLLSGNNSGTVTLAGGVSGSGGLTKTGNWTLVLGGSNSFSGVTVVQASNLFIANIDALRGSTLSNLVDGAVAFSSVTNVNFGGLAGNGALGLTNTDGNSVGLSVGFNDTKSTYGGALSGDGSLTKVGIGTLTLGSINSYSGGTVVTGGTLVATWLTNGMGTAATGSSIGSGPLTINAGTMRFGAGSLLDVTNTITGSVTFNGGTLSAAMLVNGGSIVVRSGTSTTTNLMNLSMGTLLLTNSATLKIGSGGDQWVTNAGTIELAGGNLDAGVITNTGTILGYGTLSSALNNAGVVTATNGGLLNMLDLKGVVSGAGSYRVAESNTLSFSGGGSISSSGLYNTNATIRIGAAIAGAVLTNDNQFSNAGTLAMAGGTYYTPTFLTNGPAATITGKGTLASAATLVNYGTILANSGTLTPLVIGGNGTLFSTGYVRGVSGSLQVNGIFTNDGTLNFTGNSFGTFSSAVVNRGAWVQTGTAGSLFASNLVVTTNGYINAGADSVLTFRGDLLNQSTNKVAWNTLQMAPTTNTTGNGTLFLFSGTSVTDTQVFYHPGLLLSGGFAGTPASSTMTQQVSNLGSVTGFANNFAVGQLWLTNTTLELVQAVPSGATNALFVNDLFLLDTNNTRLVIGNNMRLYFVNSNSWDLTSITLLGNAELHQLYPQTASLLVIPEPNVLLMWLSGVVTLWAARRRRVGRKEPRIDL